MSFEKLDLSEIPGIVEKGNTPKRTRTAATIDTSVRTHSTWFKLKQVFGNCSNEDCIDPRLTINGGNKSGAMISVVKDKETCRYCFLAGYLL